MACGRCVRRSVGIFRSRLERLVPSMALGRMTFAPGQRVGMLDGLGGQMWLEKHFVLHRGRDPHVVDGHDLHFADGKGLWVCWWAEKPFFSLSLYPLFWEACFE
jgi:hypothetical protein